MALYVNVFDMYEGEELLAAGVSLLDAATVKVVREEDTDGECDIVCYDVSSHKDVTHLVNLYTPYSDEY